MDRKHSTQKRISFEKAVFEIRTAIVIEIVISVILFYFSLVVGNSFFIANTACILVINLMRAVTVGGSFLACCQHRKYLQSMWAASVSMAAGGVYLVTAVLMLYARPLEGIGAKKMLLVLVLALVLIMIAIPDLLAACRREQIQLKTYFYLSVASVGLAVSTVVSALLVLFAPANLTFCLSACGILFAGFSMILSGYIARCDYRLRKTSE